MDLFPKRARTTDHEPESDRWSSIHIDILTQISDKIVTYADHFRFVTTCRSWYSLATDFDKSRSGPLYMAGTDGSGPDPRRVAFQDPASGASLALDLPETAGTRCWGSPFGWIITFKPSNQRLTLVNPFTKSTMHLPKIPKSYLTRFRFVMRAFLTANPETDPENSIVVFVAGCQNLGFVRPAKNRRVWSRIRGDFDSTVLANFDFACSGGKLYGLKNEKTLFLLELDHRGEKGRIAPRAVQTLTLELLPYVIPLSYYSTHIVDLNGELCLCVRYYSSSSCCSTIDFKIFKIDLSGGGLTRISSLGGKCLYLGHNGSFACEARYPPGGLFEGPDQNVKRSEYVSNYIFYSQWSPRRLCFDLEVWDLVNSSKVYSRINPLTSTRTLYGPLWILP